jgi:hypothetical protein
MTADNDRLLKQIEQNTRDTANVLGQVQSQQATMINFQQRLDKLPDIESKLETIIALQQRYGSLIVIDDPNGTRPVTQQQINGWKDVGVTWVFGINRDGILKAQPEEGAFRYFVLRRVG